MGMPGSGGAPPGLVPVWGFGLRTGFCGFGLNCGFEFWELGGLFGLFGLFLLGIDAACACGITSQSTSPVSGSTISPLTPRIMRGERASLSWLGATGYTLLFLRWNSKQARAYCCMA